MKRVGIIYRPHLPRAQELACELERKLNACGVSSWQCSAKEEAEAVSRAVGSDLIVSIGGDGTILRAVHIASRLSLPVLGVNLGRIGFIVELSVDDFWENLPGIIEGEGMVEERTMLEVMLSDASFHVLNEIVVGRGATAHMSHVEMAIDEEVVTVYRGDGVIVATATGSTAYSLAAGGPILHPLSREMVIQPVSCHLAPSYALVVLPRSEIVLTPVGSRELTVSLDGQIDLPLSSGTSVRVKLSSRVARFLRLRDPDHFYGSLYNRLREE